MVRSAVRAIVGGPEPIEYTKEFYEDLLMNKNRETVEAHKQAFRKKYPAHYAQHLHEQESLHQRISEHYRLLAAEEERQKPAMEFTANIQANLPHQNENELGKPKYPSQ